MKISIDLDSTLADTIERYCTLWNWMQGTNYEKSQVQDWDLHNFFQKKEDGQLLPVTKPECYGFFVNVWRDWIRVKPTEEGLGSKIRQLQEMGHEIWIITSQQEATREYIIRWFNYNDIPSKILCFVEGIPLKALFPTTLYIDDYPKLFESLPEGKMQFLYSQPWNAKVPEQPEIVERVNSFDEVIEKFG